MNKTCYGMHLENSEIVVTESEIVGAGKGDTITTAYGRTVHTSFRTIREVARLQNTAHGRRAAMSMCAAHGNTLSGH